MYRIGYFFYRERYHARENRLGSPYGEPPESRVETEGRYLWPACAALGRHGRFGKRGQYPKQAGAREVYRCILTAMSGRNRLHNLALGGCLVGAILWLSTTPALAPPEKAEDRAYTQHDASQAKQAPTPQQEVPVDIIPAAEPISSGGTNSSGAQDTTSDSETEKQRAQADLKAQQDMAFWAMLMVVVSAVSVGIAGVAVLLVWLTLREAGKTTKAATGAAHAANRQADAAILLEAAKIVLLRAELRPAGGGVITSEGIPANGRAPLVMLRNIGKTHAFILRTCIILRISGSPPERRYPIASQVPWLGALWISENKSMAIHDENLTISLTDQQRNEIVAGREHIWLLGCVWFKDWFGIERSEEFLLRWKRGPEPGESPEVRTGFIAHEVAQ